MASSLELLGVGIAFFQGNLPPGINIIKSALNSETHTLPSHVACATF